MAKGLLVLAATVVMAVGLLFLGPKMERQGIPGNAPRFGAAFAAEPTAVPDMSGRQAYITGRPVRIPPLKPNEMDKEAADILKGVREALAMPPSDEVPEYTAIMLRHPALYKAQIGVANQLFRGALPLRDRELAILRTAWLCKSPFEWGEHVRLGKLTHEEFDRVAQGSAAPGWDEDDRAILRAVEELHDHAMISDETWAALSRKLNEKQLIELPILVGSYHEAAYVMNALRIPLMPGNPGLSAR